MDRRTFVKDLGLIVGGALLHPRAYAATEQRVLAVAGFLAEERNTPRLMLFDCRDGISKVWEHVGAKDDFRNLPNSPVITDADGDGLNEIVAADRRQVMLWKTPNTTPYTAPITEFNSFTTVEAGDPNQDGRTEILVGAGNAVYAFHFDGKRLQLAHQPITIPHTNPITNIRIGDADNDGSLEVVIGGGAARLLDGGRPDGSLIDIYSMDRNCALIKKAEIRSSGIMNNTIRINDADNDGRLEVITSGGGRVAAWRYAKPTGRYEQIAEYQVDQSTEGQPESMGVGDVDNDGRNEVVIATNGFLNMSRKRTALHVLRYAKGQFERLSGQETGTVAHWAGIVIGDIDGDGKNEFSLMGKTVYKHVPETREYQGTRVPGLFQPTYCAIGDLKL